MGNDIRKPDEFTFWFPPYFFLDFVGEIHIAMGFHGKSEVLFQNRHRIIVCGENIVRYYVTTTVLNQSWKGTTEQFVLHFNEQFRQLDEVSPPNEILPYPMRLTLLHAAVNAIPELRVVKPSRNFLTCPPTPLVPP